MSEILRTPEERFNDLPGYAFAPHYLEGLAGFEGLRLHFLDEGPSDAERTFLCLHGQPTWSYLYRDLIPRLTAAGHRAVAPDLFGFGRSDKPVDDAVYTFDFHRKALLAVLEHLDLRDVTLVVHDWGGILGLTLPPAMPERFARLLITNTALATGERPLGQGFLDWRDWANQNPDMNVGRLMGRACPRLSEGEQLAYSAPFPDRRFKGGVRRFPNLVADRPDAPGAEIARQSAHWWHTEWSGPSFMVVGMKDPVLGPPVMRLMQRTIRGCPDPLPLAEAGHFVPEWSAEFAAPALAALDAAS